MQQMNPGAIMLSEFEYVIDRNGELWNAQGRKAKVRAIDEDCLHPADAAHVTKLVRSVVRDEARVTTQWPNERGDSSRALHVCIEPPPGEGEPVILNALSIALQFENNEEQGKQWLRAMLASKGVL